MQNNEHILEAVSCISSKAMREYLRAHVPDWSALQAATVASEYMPRQKLVRYLQALFQTADAGYEKELLCLAVEEMQLTGATRNLEKTTAFYLLHKDNSVHFPLFPFLEICNLPVLYKAGDVISYRLGGNNRYACVQHPPLLKPGYCDFTDECYYCHDLDCSGVTPEQLAEGYEHEHIHLCDADNADEAKLSPAKKRQLQVVRDFIKEQEKTPAGNETV